MGVPVFGGGGLKSRSAPGFDHGRWHKGGRKDTLRILVASGWNAVERHLSICNGVVPKKPCGGK